ncbi:LemA family protein [Marivirga atlantica]|jgi:LemA protein|uniref:LemA family protein n=1 Tax=Marivirga atlantica TaxID=1548457 RepID=A0A937DDC9_9BACT|nr:LemA family protein [Marivirga atlantica]MBL0764087.1 LemA family protein [Marivirga atlantica]
MKRGLIIGGIILLVVIILYRLFAGTYNNMVEKQETVSEAWSQVENVYQRRSDLIPNLVNTVKGYADFEKETLQGVIEARAKATSVNVDASNLNEQNIQQFQQAQQGLTSALSRLMVVVERYPDLKANQNFLQLQSQLEGTENRIAVERRRFNEQVKEYNAYIKKFPQVTLAGMYGFEQKGYFEADAGAEKAPEVKF